MADGDCDAALLHPVGSGPWPGAINFADALDSAGVSRHGPPACRRGLCGADPQSVLPHAQGAGAERAVDFGKPEDRAKLTDLMAPLTTEVKARDGAAWVAHLDTLPQVNKKAPISVSGYSWAAPTR